MPAILAGGAIPAGVHGTTTQRLFHVCDWLPTLLAAVNGGSPPPPLADAASAVIPYDGIGQWEMLTDPSANDTGHSITATAGAPRTEVVLDHCLEGFSAQPSGCNHYGDACAGGCGALIMGDVKLVKGPNGGEWTNLTNGTTSDSFAGVACKPHCVFNLTEDESEHHDLSATRPDLLATLLRRFTALADGYHPPKFNPPADNAGCCAAAAANGNFLSPWTVAPPPPPPPPLEPLGPCIGGPGDLGWEVRNGTGGGGPDFARFSAAGLGGGAVEACRRRCCATHYCVSIVLHARGCYLNNASGVKAPYSRPATLMAFVKRNLA